MNKLAAWIYEIWVWKASTPGENSLEGAKKLLATWPDKDHIPDDMPMSSFGLAAYLYCRHMEIERRNGRLTK